MSKHKKKVRAVFFKNLQGKEPVKDWINSLPSYSSKQMRISISIVISEFSSNFIKKIANKISDDLWVMYHKELELYITFTVDMNCLIFLDGFHKKPKDAIEKYLYSTYERLQQFNAQKGK